jgi:glycosyltransferase involved in cell wall biosynthesis
MTEEILVSVVIASYNSGKTIKKTLQSLENQTTQGRFEVIVVDSSTDDTAEAIEKKFPNVRVIHFSERKLPGDARNFGISGANGNIIAFLDADCEASSDWVEKIITAHKSPWPAIGGAIANGTRGGCVTWAAYFCEFSQWMPGTTKKWMGDVAAANMSYKKEVFNKYGSFIEGTYCSDTEFHWRMAKDDIRILFDPSLLVTHHSIGTLSRFLRHETFHGMCFARVRSKALKFSLFRRFVYILFSPFLPARLFWKVYFLNSKNKIYWRCFLKSMPLLILGIASWSLGEAKGYFRNE